MRSSSFPAVSKFKRAQNSCSTPVRHHSYIRIASDSDRTAQLRTDRTMRRARKANSSPTLSIPIELVMPKCRLREALGTEKELALHRGAYRRVQAGSGEVVLIEGNVGVGRSALVHMALSEEACFVVRSRCDTVEESFSRSQRTARENHLHRWRTRWHSDRERKQLDGERSGLYTSIHPNSSRLVHC